MTNEQLVRSLPASVDICLSFTGRRFRNARDRSDGLRVPVISSNSSALPEVCGDAAILVDPTNTDQIAARTGTTCSRTESLREDYIARGLARAKLFSWDKASRKNLGSLP